MDLNIGEKTMTKKYGKSPAVEYLKSIDELDAWTKALTKSQKIPLWTWIRLLFVKKQSSADLYVGYDWGNGDESGVIVFKELNGVYYIIECGDIK